MPPPLQSSLEHRPHLSDHHSISNNYSHSGHYTPVKVEDDHYISSHQNSLHYSYSNGTSQSQNGIDWQGGYSSERVHLQR
ncbi:hypothetical protein CPB83DRAFT_849497 [Crepidotus variabilis]|uniref:Uncharacterized protein n=1 Tax=Crepidotus variabilis TaxID=179855 RepID=A0A9P6ELS3_9AGAR|nr:hypothetical protein CPB83DRAFT_849497 [Crepidotus variabilis]